LPIDDYAAFTAFSAVLYLFPDIIGGGINRALVRFSSEHISESGYKPYQLYFINFVLQFCLYASFCILILIIEKEVSNILFGKQSFDFALRYGLIAGTGFLITEANRGIYRAEERFGEYVKTLFLRQIVILVIISILYLRNRLNFQYAAKAVILSELIVASVITLSLFNNFKFKNFIQLVKTQSYIIKDFISSSGWLIVYTLIHACFSRLDIFMLSHYSVDEELANYGVAFRFYSTGLLLLGSIHTVLLPKFSKIDMQETVKQHRFTLNWLKSTGWIIIPIALVLSSSKSLFIYIIGPQYEKAFLILIIFSIGIWISLMSSPLVNVLISRKDFKFLCFIGLGAFLINFIGNYLLIPIWGGLGAAIVTVFSHGFNNISSAIKVFSYEKSCI